METAIVAIVASSLAAALTFLLGKKKDKAAIDNLIADTAAKIVEASVSTIENLTTRVTKAEEYIKVLKVAQKECETRERTLNERVTDLETELKHRTKGKK